MKNFSVTQIGKIKINDEGMFVVLDKKYTDALKELDGFSHLNIFWWFDGCDNKNSRNILKVSKPYKNSPSVIGTFATRSPQRPNPIAITIAQIIYIDHENGIIQISYTDADNESPVIDLKPYTPSLDRPENPTVPKWCSHWPESIEKSGEFDWENEFNF